MARIKEEKLGTLVRAAFRFGTEEIDRIDKSDVFERRPPDEGPSLCVLTLHRLFLEGSNKYRIRIEAIDAPMMPKR
jgi:hypothetical protein